MKSARESRQDKTMKTKTRLSVSSTIAAVVLILAGTIAGAQTPQPQNSPETVQAQQQQNAQANAAANLRMLNLTPDQIQRIRDINLELKDQRQTAAMKLRQAQRALAEAVESPTPDEAVIAQRSREVAEAQSNTIRLRSVTEARVLQVLTPEQRTRLKEIRQQNLARVNQGAGGNVRAQRQGLQRGANASLLTPKERRAMTKKQRKNQQ